MPCLFATVNNFRIVSQLLPTSRNFCHRTQQRMNTKVLELNFWRIFGELLGKRDQTFLYVLFSGTGRSTHFYTQFDAKICFKSVPITVRFCIKKLNNPAERKSSNSYHANNWQNGIKTQNSWPNKNVTGWQFGSIFGRIRNKTCL
jgi:hypothetical protein